jgi:L-asparaginase II
MDWPLRSYTDPAHPAQKIILKTIAEIGEMDIGEIALAPDGCSIPNFAFPMDRLAYMFARLGDPEGSHFGEPLMRIKEAILAHPHMISGTGRFDETLMDQKPGEIISKAGAMGLQAVALRHEGEWLGIAAKIEDGNYPAVTRLTYTLLEELGLDLVEDKFNPKLIKTRSEEVVGSFKVFGTLGNVAR